MKDKNLWNTNTISLYTPENFFFNNFSLAVGQIWHTFLNDFFLFQTMRRKKSSEEMKKKEKKEKIKTKNEVKKKKEKTTSGGSSIS